MRSHPNPRHRTASRDVVRTGVATLLTAFALVGCGSDGTSTPTREYVIALRAEEQSDRYTYVADGEVDVRAGDRVTFEMSNEGALIHDLVVIDEAGDPIATGPAVGPGGSLSLTVDFEEPGLYRLRCNVDDHLTVYGMQVFLQVNHEDGSPPDT